MAIQSFIPKVNIDRGTLGILSSAVINYILLKSIYTNGGFRKFLAAACMELRAVHPKGDSQILRPFNIEHSFDIIPRYFDGEFSPL